MAFISSHSLSQSWSSLSKFAIAHPVSSVAITSLSVMVFKRLHDDYQAWLELGPGGGPHNPAGFLLAHGLELVASRDLKSTQCYESSNPTKGYLEDIPIREGSEPELSKWIYPVRQLTSKADGTRIRAINDILIELASKQDLIFTAMSVLEGGHSVALFIKDKSEGPDSAKPARGRELFHCHDTEGSAHVTLSPTDAKLVLDRGWALRHPLSGKLNMALTYVMVYSPRNDAEMELIKRIAQAAIDYALQRRREGLL